ncbi:RNA polymerase sigma factor [Anaerotignum lactatifermentans]|uniref:RNA polymerase sigma factor n=1 Tax=Anaerotignum lactatifermentans TaxID=160404 RepID=A0ABS2GCX4_9FIRM|nr:RNA polymerase sigma factor [Anaerotignum lactatifermentans]MBM6830036.1 RNA polymerase sigma factor [Anaerotignum lactatifermentans]MBM6878628.1 RNA polymerase sigma factor [Anaerotignum lactatifermentans]MBM6951659.1 RNA polymerase sigma factor [Anaerotignum lactatifermentans]
MNKANMFEQFINENVDAAYRFAYTYVKNKEDAEDILNESVVKALRSINSLKDTGKMKSWFYTIIARTALSHIKDRQKIIYLEDGAMEHLEPLTDDYSHISFEEMMDHLDPKHRPILVLRFLEDMTISEVAQILELNENTVKSRLYRALERLKLEIQEV